jgi:hypothetical protein
VSLQLRDAPTKMAFEQLQRETGINFILDKDIKADGVINSPSSWGRRSMRPSIRCSTERARPRRS